MRKVSAMSVLALAGAYMVPAIALGQGFINETATASGSVTATGTEYVQDPPIQMPPQSATLTTLNTSVSVGNHNEVWADASNSLNVSSTVLSAVVRSDADWYGSPSLGSPWVPDATDSASLSVSFQVPVTGLYSLQASGSGAFLTSQEANQLRDQATLVGTSGGNTVFDIVMDDGQGWGDLGPAGDLFTLTTGTQYTLSLSCLGQSADWEEQPAFSNYMFATFTATAVPEPGSLSLLGLATAGLLSRRRRHAGRN